LAPLWFIYYLFVKILIFDLLQTKKFEDKDYTLLKLGRHLGKRTNQVYIWYTDWTTQTQKHFKTFEEAHN